MKYRQPISEDLHLTSISCTYLELEELINQCRKNNRNAQEHLFKQFAPLMMAVCLRYLNHREDAEECMLTGFQKFFEKISQFEFSNSNAFKAYLKRIMVNECLMEIRKKRIITEQYSDSNERYEHVDGLDLLSAKEILQLLNKIPIGYKTVFNLFVIENYSHKEIAKLLAINEGTSKSQLSKARFLLQQLITAHGK